MKIFHVVMLSTLLFAGCDSIAKNKNTIKSKPALIDTATLVKMECSTLAPIILLSAKDKNLITNLKLINFIFKFNDTADKSTSTDYDLSGIGIDSTGKAYFISRIRYQKLQAIPLNDYNQKSKLIIKNLCNNYYGVTCSPIEIELNDEYRISNCPADKSIAIITGNKFHFLYQYAIQRNTISQNSSVASQMLNNWKNKRVQDGKIITLISVENIVCSSIIAEQLIQDALREIKHN